MFSLPRKEINGEGESGKPELSGFVSSLCLCRVGKETISVQSKRLPSLGIMISRRTVPWMRDLSPALIAWLSKVPSYFFFPSRNPALPLTTLIPTNKGGP